ncbi:hypothetical protein D1816_02320 [Aquimarina sp. AD10]|uniref:hypothetical protein n=1 Tax=Aquimarina sp. AD10 TaxID=1714849 RepID=UPI000E51124D|nr:hypothetical protein [Aquimarina sp. AD10]AXT59229.1 hypothetical protein D1816_02320 [Aquimarina sp. AD10]RKM92719.1 hypothetical protein D7033_20895 [Aquimarina sp. AD10]
MKKSFYILVLVLLITNFLTAQNDWKTELKLTEYNSILHKRIYRIQVDNYQIVELTEFKSGKFNGSLTNTIWKANRKHHINKLITQKIKIPNLMVEKLISDLLKKDFENIPDCKDTKNCIQGLDGTTISFSVIKSGTEWNYSYWEPESDFYYKDDIIPEVLKVREILKSINSEFDLWENFTKFRDRLPKGKYFYGMTLMEKK